MQVVPRRSATLSVNFSLGVPNRKGSRFSPTETDAQHLARDLDAHFLVAGSDCPLSYSEAAHEALGLLRTVRGFERDTLVSGLINMMLVDIAPRVSARCADS